MSIYVPVCVQCACEMRCAKHEFEVAVGGEQPCAVYSGDKYRCPGCEMEVVVGFGSGPIAEEHRPGFKEHLERYKPLRITA